MSFIINKEEYIPLGDSIIQNVKTKKKFKAVVLFCDNGFSFPHTSSNKDPRSLILSRFSTAMRDKSIPDQILEKIKSLYFNVIESDTAELLDEPSYIEFLNRLEELLSRRATVLENYKIIPRLEKVPPRVDLLQLDPFSWIDETLNKAQFKIEGKLPYGTKTLGYQIMYDTFNSLKDTIAEYLKKVTPGMSQNVIVDGLIQSLENWQIEINKNLQVPVEEVFRRAHASGIIDTGVERDLTLVDRLALEFIIKHPEGILPTLKTFGEALRVKFADIIAKHFEDPSKALSVFALTEDMNKEVNSEKWKLMRIARTETNKVVNSGRLLGWSKDPYKYYYKYLWNAAPDNRVKQISLWRMNNGPWTFDEIVFLWEHEEQLLSDGLWQNDTFNNRCASSRTPVDEEFKGNRFAGQENNFKKTINILGVE